MRATRPTRRHVLASSAAVIAAAGVADWQSVAGAAEKAASFIVGPPVPDQDVRQITPHVRIILAPDGFPTPENQGLMANITFIEGKDGVVVFDTGASLQIGRMAVRQLRAVTPKPVIALINSHYHGDHWLGNHGFVEAFGDGLPIYAHPESRKGMAGMHGDLWLESLAKWTNGATLGTKMVLPNRDAAHGQIIPLGGLTLRIHHYGIAHTPGDICLEVVEDSVMCVGDVMMDRRIANMDDGSYLGSFKTFDALETGSKTKIWLPGHGVPSAAVITWQRELFAGIYETCEAAVKAGNPIETARAKVLKDPRVTAKASSTKGFDSNIGKYISLAYLEAEQASF